MDFNIILTVKTCTITNIVLSLYYQNETIKKSHTMEINLKSFVQSYLETAAWVTVDSDENDQFTTKAEQTAEADCIKFINAVKTEFGEALAIQLLTVEGTDVMNRSAHDFFLTRNSHGAGFWDNPENYQGQEIADRLSKVATDMGSVDVYHVKGKKSKLTF